MTCRRFNQVRRTSKASSLFDTLAHRDCRYVGASSSGNDSRYWRRHCAALKPRTDLFSVDGIGKSVPVSKACNSVQLRYVSACAIPKPPTNLSERSHPGIITRKNKKIVLHDGTVNRRNLRIARTLRTTSPAWLMSQPTRRVSSLGEVAAWFSGTSRGFLTDLTGSVIRTSRCKLVAKHVLSVPFANARHREHIGLIGILGSSGLTPNSTNSHEMIFPQRRVQNQ